MFIARRGSSMPDIVDRDTRSRMMSGIRGKDTKPELWLRSALHREGFRFRLHVRDIPGRPDIVLPRHGAIVLVNGCFWHGHGCPGCRVPGTNRAFWEEKIRANRKRDLRNIRACLAAGWRVAVVWECAVKRASRVAGCTLPQDLSRWIRNGPARLQFPPRPGKSGTRGTACHAGVPQRFDLAT
jgi:DNA mismatch endonuclease (patch repair protein)